MEYFIYVDISSMQNDAIDINVWKNQNSTILIPIASANYFCIDVEKLYSAIDKNNWLDDYGKYIDFSMSKTTIETLHVIDDATTQILIDKEVGKFEANSISKLDLEDKYNFNFMDENYIQDAITKKINNYHILSFDANGIFQNATKGEYDNKKYCFSSPFLRSITDINLVNDNTIFNFVLFGEPFNEKLGFRVDTNSGYKYYDFSQVPPPEVKYDSNNPLSYGNSKGNVF
jgi:hypothetical protein